jgi:hypothetical protein
MPVLADRSKIEDRRRNGRESVRWWVEEGEQLYESIQTVADRIHENMSQRRRQNYLYAMTYNDIDLVGHYAATDYSERSSAWGSNGRITLNIVQNAIDTACSMVAKNRPKPLFLGDGADYQTFQKAEKLTRYVAGVIEDTELYEIGEKVFRDACVYGTGALKLLVDEDEKRVRAEWVWIGEILVDDLEGMRELPTQIHQRTWRSRDELIELYPDCKEEILKANTDSGGAMSQSVADVIPVIESWHLKSGARAKDGRHVISIETAALLDEEYKKDYYPIFFFRWYHQTLGFWGRGIAQEILNLQRDINDTLRDIRTAQRRVCASVCFVPTGSNVVEDHLASNEIGRLVYFAGETPPQYGTPPGMSPEVYSHLWQLVQQAYQIIGINQSMAQGQKQPGLESGAAIREATDIASGRFQIIGQRWEGFFVRLAKAIVDLSKDLYSSDEDLSVIVKDSYGDGLKRVQWSDVDMDDDRFKIFVYPVSGLPSTPAGRLQTITEWAANGWIPKEVMMSLLEIPDLKRFANLETASADLVQATIGRIKDEDRYDIDWKPVPQMNLALAMQVAAQEVVLARLQGCSESVLSKLALYAQDIDFVMKQQQQAAAPPPAPPGAMGVPQGPTGGMAPPPSPPQQPFQNAA